MPLEPLADKYRSFNWEVLECDGNDIEEFIATVERAKQVKGKPQVIIANTVPGKGVSYMEGDYTWHGKPPNKAQADEALAELQSQREGILANV
jgi:transketolase